MYTFTPQVAATSNVLILIAAALAVCTMSLYAVNATLTLARVVVQNRSTVMAYGKLRAHRNNGRYTNGALRNSARVLAVIAEQQALRTLQATCVHARKTMDNSDPGAGTISRCLDCNAPLGVAGIRVN